MANSDVIMGIDLGTTNSLVSIIQDGVPTVLPVEGSPLVPSVVGIDDHGQLVIGQTARNQYMAAPERTVRSIKRHMGEAGYTVTLGSTTYTPEEISAFILRRLAEQASATVGSTVHRAVITIPAYFADRQRQATMRAGELAGLEVVRLLHEPTAAALVYGMGKEGASTSIVYDLGGGTFDVSVVEVGGGLTEVRASHGNRQLGGDDFDQLIVDEMLTAFQTQHQMDLRGDRVAMARLRTAAEAAKIHLSDHPYVEIRQEFLAARGGSALHLEMELTRTRFEELIAPLLQSTLEAVRRALHDSGVDRRALDAVLLVGGSTRIPAVHTLVAEELGMEPRQDVHPDLAVALGAGLQAGVLQGLDVDSVLVDICPHTLGVRAHGYWNGVETYDKFVPMIHRNTAIPVTKSEFFYTMYSDQTDVKIAVYQGEEPVATRNTPLGEFVFTGLSPSSDGSSREVLVAFDYDVNGILHVAAVDRRTGKRQEMTLHTSALREVEEKGPTPEWNGILRRLRDLDPEEMTSEAITALRQLLDQAPSVAAANDMKQVEDWQDRASDFLLEYDKEY